MTSIKQIYGLTEERDPAEEKHVHGIISYMEQINRVATLGQYLVEFFPSLLRLSAWFAPFKQGVRMLLKRHWDYVSGLVQRQNEYDERLAQSLESFARRCLTNKENSGMTGRRSSLDPRKHLCRRVRDLLDCDANNHTNYLPIPGMATADARRD